MIQLGIITVNQQKQISLPILPIFIPDRARARRADWAPGPGVLVLKTQIKADCTNQQTHWSKTAVSQLVFCCQGFLEETSYTNPIRIVSPKLFIITEHSHYENKLKQCPYFIALLICFTQELEVRSIDNNTEFLFMQAILTLVLMKNERNLMWHTCYLQ